jgi:hypothetical protein
MSGRFRVGDMSVWGAVNGNKRPCPNRVKERKTPCEQMFSALPSKADLPAEIHGHVFRSKSNIMRTQPGVRTDHSIAAKSALEQNRGYFYSLSNFYDYGGWQYGKAKQDRFIRSGE